MTPPRLNLHASNHTNTSTYTLADVHGNTAQSPLLQTPTPVSAYGATFPRSPGVPTSGRKLLMNAAMKMATIFIISTAILGGILYFALPTLEQADRPMLKIPKSFAELQALNTLLKKYRDIYPYRIVVCYVIVYLFLQAFSLPGSMYLSILGGAVWGVPRALPLVCCCVASGATLCYLISAALGPALLTLPKWKARLDKWATKIDAQRDNLLSFLIVLRIAPLPPHWVVNLICPHVGIGIIPFWISTALGILGVSVIHTTIGGGLDEMTSADDFHLISWKNFFGLSAVAIGVMIPVGLRYYFRKQVELAADVEPSDNGEQDEVMEDIHLENALPKRTGRVEVVQDEHEFFEEEEDEDEDIILEAGPTLTKSK